MRYKIMSLFIVLSVLWSSAFSYAKQDANPIVTVLDSNGQPTTQITDGDNIQLQVTFPTSISQQEDIDFLFDDTAVGACIIPSGSTISR